MTLVRAILTYRSPQPKHIQNLMNAIFNTVSEHTLYIANPDTTLILHSSDVAKSMHILEPMTRQKLDKALLYKIQKDILGDYRLYSQEPATVRSLPK